jgi:hypothetical protein
MALREKQKNVEQWFGGPTFHQCEVKMSAKFYLAVKSNVSLCLSTTPWMSVWGKEIKFLDLRLCGGKRSLPHYRGTEKTVVICGNCGGLDLFTNISPLVYYQMFYEKQICDFSSVLLSRPGVAPFLIIQGQSTRYKDRRADAPNICHWLFGSPGSKLQDSCGEQWARKQYDSWRKILVVYIYIYIYIYIKT